MRGGVKEQTDALEGRMMSVPNENRSCGGSNQCSVLGAEFH
jgi:hypothetical protein